jgi:hypothetical protein
VTSDFRQAGWGYTSDGGATWTFPGVLENNVFRSDPVLFSDETGRFFYLSLLENLLDDMWGPANGGQSFTRLGPATRGDKEWFTGDNIVIAGFLLGNHKGDDRVVIRGIGPSLIAAGVSNALADPTLELRDSNGALLIANNDWQADPAQAAELTAAGLAPANPLESGIAATLPPGPYTALLAGLNNGTGIGVVEVYDRGSP